MTQAKDMATRVPQYLSRSYQILFWESDEVGIFAINFTLVSSIGKLFAWNWQGVVSWVALFVLPSFYSHYKKKFPAGFFKHTLYFCGWLVPRHYPGFFVKRFYE